MKKRLFSLLLGALLLLLLLPAGALAEDIVIDFGSIRAGDTLDLQLVSTSGGTGTITEGSIPPSCRIDVEERDGLPVFYLRGTPGLAGDCAFTLTVAETVELETVDENGETGVTTEQRVVAVVRVSGSVLPALPVVHVEDLDCFVGDEARLVAEASSSDGGALSYQWFRAESREDRDGRPLEGKTARELTVDTEFPDELYYYCVVTNNNNGRTESVSSETVRVRVAEPQIVELSVKTLPEKLEYTEGDTLETKGLELQVKYDNGVVVTEQDGFTVTPRKLDVVGTQTVTVSYQEKTCTFAVIVKEMEEKIVGLSLRSLPTKRDYKQGEWLDTTGLVLLVHTNKGNVSEMTTGFDYSPRELNSPGLQTVTISFEDQSTSFTVTVEPAEKTILGIEIKQLPTKLDYKAGDTFRPEGMVLRVLTDQGEEEVRSGYSCSPTRFTREGTQTVTVSYAGKLATMELTVAPAEEETPDSPGKSDEPAPKQDASEKQEAEPKKSGGSSATLLTVLLIVLIIAIAALLAYLYILQQDRINAFFRKLTKEKGSGRR